MAERVVQLPAEYRGDPRLESAWSFHQEKLTQIDDRFQPFIDNAEKRVRDTVADWNRIFGQVNRGPTYARVWYFPFLTALAIAEVPLNRLSFELFFRESPLLSLMVAFVVGVLLMTLAHFTGLGLRRLGHNISYTINQNPGMSALTASIPPLLSLAICFSLIFAICYGVGVLRQGYLDFTTHAAPTIEQMINDERVIEAATQLVLATTLGVAGWIFFFINAAIVAVGILAAFFCHDPHPEYEKADLAKIAAAKRLERVKVQYGKARAAEDGRFANEKLQLQR